MNLRELLAKHRRHVEMSPGAGEDAQKYALAVIDDIESDCAQLFVSAPVPEERANVTTKGQFIGSPNGHWWYPGKRALRLSMADMSRRSSDFEWKDDPAPVEHGGTGLLWPFYAGKPMLWHENEPQSTPSPQRGPKA